jgi:hypothetical protein
MTEAVQTLEPPAHRYKRGDVREDGKIFWSYRFNGRYQDWLSEEKFLDRKTKDKERRSNWKKENKERIRNVDILYRKNNKEKVRQSSKNWSQNNKERINQKRRERRQKPENREKEKELALIYYHKNTRRARNAQLKRNFGISVEEYDKLLKKQNDKCAICEAISCKSGNRFAVDHDHKTGLVRGLLCFACNTSLGKFNDSQELLYKAISYLQTHNNQ